MIEKLEDHTMIPAESLETILILAMKATPLTGALVQCGCWKGGSAALLRLVLGARPVWLFDSFEGMPEPQYEDGKRAQWKYNQRGEGWHACTVDDVREAFTIAKIPFDDVSIVRGWFEDTIPSAEVGPIAFLHIDADWYDSTRIPLETFYERMQPGGIVLIDDYESWAGCKRAVNEFRSQHDIEADLNVLNRVSVYWTVDA